MEIKSIFHPLRRLEFLRMAAVVVLSLLAAVDRLAAEEAPVNPGNWMMEATNHLGQWIWDTNTLDKQTCRFWKPFEVPAGAKISHATLRITVDNGYTLFLDGEEIGRGSDWRTVTEYDVTWLLNPGRHVLAVEGFNDRLEAGLIFGLEIQLADRRVLEIFSDDTWSVVPNPPRHWASRKTPLPDWHPAVVIGSMNHHPWEIWPVGFTVGLPLRPVIVHFWQAGWFQLTLFTICLLAVCFSIWLATQLASQAKAQKFLQVERVRIARDIHDDLGAQLTQLLLMGEVAQREQPEDSAARGQFNQMCERARELAHALDEVVWAVNSRRDTVRDFTSYVCKYAQIFFSATGIRCRLDVEPEIPATTFDLPVRRHLFLAVKEALNNAAKHSQADELFLRINRRHHKLSVVVEDNGRGFDTAQIVGERNGLTNMWQRMGEIGGTCEISSQPGGGCRVVFTVPLPREPRGWFRRAPRGQETTGQI
jgi:signal transduction histidine kinase